KGQDGGSPQGTDGEIRHQQGRQDRQGRGREDGARGQEEVGPAVCWQEEEIRVSRARPTQNKFQALRRRLGDGALLRLPERRKRYGPVGGKPGGGAQPA